MKPVPSGLKRPVITQLAAKKFLNIEVQNMERGSTPEFTQSDSIKISDLREWHALRLKCTECDRDASLFKSLLSKRFDQSMQVRDALSKAKCSKCGAKGRASWAVYRMKRY